MNEVRIDKWMWATRIFKTRSVAADACKKGRVMMSGVAVKPSRMVKVGDVIEITFGNKPVKVRVLAAEGPDRRDVARAMYEVIE